VAVTVEHRPAPLSGGLALAVTVVTALLLGVATDQLFETVLGFLAAGLLTGGTLAAERENNAIRAAGSFAVVLGGFLAVAGVLSIVGASVGGVALGLGVPLSMVAIALGVVVAPDVEDLAPGKSALYYAVGLTVLGALGAAAVHTNSFAMPFVLAGEVLGAIVAGATHNDLAGLATLLICLGALGAVARRFLSALPDRHHPEVSRSARRWGRRGMVVGWLFLVVGLVLFAPALVADGDDTPLADTAGGLLADVATAWGLHVLLAVATVLLAAALVAIRLYRRIDRTTPDDVGDRLARATGGFGLLLVVPVASLFVKPVEPLAPRLPDPAVTELTSLVGSYGAGTVLYLLVIVALLVAVALTLGFGFVLTADAAPDGSGTVALGAGLVFASAIGAADWGVDPLLVLGAGAAALFVWDVGENAAGLGRQLGRRAETSRGEFVHGGASALVAGGAVGVAYGAGTTASAVTVPPVGWLLVLALACSTVAGVLFLWALRS